MKKSFCASKKEGKTYRRRRLARCCSSTSRHLSKWRERSSSAAAAPVASKTIQIGPPFLSGTDFKADDDDDDDWSLSKTFLFFRLKKKRFSMTYYARKRRGQLFWASDLSSSSSLAPIAMHRKKDRASCVATILMRFVGMHRINCRFFLPQRVGFFLSCKERKKESSRSPSGVWRIIYFLVKEKNDASNEEKDAKLQDPMQKCTIKK